MQARYKLIQNENCRLRVKGRPSIKCTPAILTFERPHSSNQHVAYITNTRVYVIIEIICLCLNQSCFIPIVLSTVNCDKKREYCKLFQEQNVSQILAMCCSTKLPHYHISKVFIYITLVATLGSRGYFFLIHTVCASLTRLCCEPSVSIRKKYPLEPRVSSSRREV